MKDTKFPSFFKPIFWWCKLSEIDADKDYRSVIVSTINYGGWEHWQWIFGYYGKDKIRQIIKDTPRSELRKGSFRLISLILNIKKIKYASRGAKIKAERNI